MTRTTTSNSQKRRVPFLFYAFLAFLQQQQSHSVTVAAFGSSTFVQNRRIPSDGLSVDIISRNAALVDTNGSNPAGNVKKGIKSRVNKFLRSKQIKNKNKSVVQEVKDIDSIRNLLGQGREEDTYTAVIFHAPFCKACRASLPLFEELAKQYSNNSNSNNSNNNIGNQKKNEEEQKQIIPNVKFVSVPVTQDNSKQLQEDFSVTRFPLAHIYDPKRGLIDARPVLKKMFPKFEERLESVVVKTAPPLSLSMTNDVQ
jgi:thiol-disulfide isomerase/thioredoxin